MDVALFRNIPPNTVGVQVELFSMARLVCGRSHLERDLPCDATLADVAHALVVACPALRGLAITTDGTGLLASYALNLNDQVFVTDTGVHPQQGDTLLLFPSEAGG
jgi:molybdopterin converting factor small subunit